MRPQWGQLESGRAAAVGQDARSRFLAQVAGPYFGELRRQYALAAPADNFGALPGQVGAGVVSDPEQRPAIEVDVAVFGPALPGEPHRVSSVGEAKLGQVMDRAHVRRLGRARDLLATRGYDTSQTVLACYSGAGFSPELRRGTPGETVKLIGPNDLYGDPVAR